MGLHQEVQFPPWPIPDGKEFSDVSLENSASNNSVVHFLELNSLEMGFTVSLELGDDFRQSLVTHLFKFTNNTSSEEDLGQTDSEFIFIELQSFDQFLTRGFTVNVTWWRCLKSLNCIPTMTPS